MRTGISAPDSQHLVGNAQVFLYRDVRTNAVAAGTATPVLELTPYANQISATDNSATVKLAFQDTFFDCTYQPRIKDTLSIVVDGFIRSITFVDSVSDFTESRGSRSMTVKGRSRDGLGGWRSTPATTPVLPLGTIYTNILDIVCGTLMALQSDEYVLPSLAYSVPHSNVQLSEMTAWDMLEQVGVASGYAPFVDVLGRVRFHQIDTLRAADLSVLNRHVIEFSTAKQVNQSGTAAIKLQWLDPLLSKQYQQDQVLGTYNITAGFFKLKVTTKTYFSEDHRQRAEEAYMKILESCNDGILGLKVATEDYEQVDEYHGHIELKTYWWLPTLYTVSLAYLLYADSIPDGVAGFVTTPMGRVLHGAALVVVLGTMMAIGTGNYEIWGQPFDYVHAANNTLIRDCNQSFQELDQTEIESSLIVSEAHAQSEMIKYLLYLNASNYELRLTMIDDARIEKGDIMLFEDGSRLMVTGFSRDYSYGSSATIDITGMLL